MKSLLVLTATLLATAPLISIAQSSNATPSRPMSGQIPADQSDYGGTTTAAESSSQQGRTITPTSSNKLFAHH